ncbi:MULTISPECIES: 30S ribosomal protein S6--L-glutamate ligase [Mesonia]|uniref:Ribosomal protein S6--L-glutamate ligase n=1 Tax=Mesonia oceanica TaxID=2687242 RepID=A0AC61YD95_9FLAO|nr:MULTISPECIES: 30S ribosomal protein S6--L-glutamate ligase [Mesonia]MAN28734.1 30S ribosomal protein S6--L-glutamate ligase [Mesonia sp.]MAQ39716.1 30S ribosomal protein S6--L-glutamate ligase [Mesonia sp.]VVV02200.1 Ribosomal protein S6--L-glutamate ligase [Mesonia oceanica]|tara:strand:- start:11498 stop:12382 length:885 start_codon:yes stop_codon:yes gene_type:complete
MPLTIKILSLSKKLYSTQRLFEAAKKRGHNVEVIDYLKCDLVIERKKPTIYYKGRLLEDVDAVIPRIGATHTYYGAAVIRQFEMMKTFSTLESQALIRSRDKLRSLQLLTKGNIGIPKTVFTNYSSNHTEQILSYIGGTPLIIKLLEGTQGLGIVLAETQNAAKSVIEAFNGLQARVIAQEFIKEAKGADIRAFVIDGQVVGAMKRQGKEGEFRSNLHRGGTSQLIQLSDEEENSAIKAARMLGLNISGVDLLQSERGPLIMEVNSSPGLEGIEGATKKDIAVSIIKYIEKNTD